MMFDFDNFQSSHPVEDSMFGNKISNNVFPAGKAKSASPSEKYASEIAEIAVQDVSDPLSRHLMMKVLLPKVEVKLVSRASSGRTSAQAVQSEWVRFMTSQYPTDLMVDGFVPDAGIVTTAYFDNIPVKLSEFRNADLDLAISEVFDDEAEIAHEELVPGTFTVTRDLLSSWIDCLNSIRAEAKEPLISLETALHDKQFSHNLSRQLDKVISNFAIRKSYEGGRYLITLGQKLYPTIAGLIVDHLMLPPEEGAAFLVVLKKELYEQSAKGPVFHGEWGKLIIDDAYELVFVLEKRRKQKLSTLLKAFD